MGQDEGLQIDNQVFVNRKNIVVGELDLAIEIVAAAFGIELDPIKLPKVHFGFFMLLLMVKAMHTMVCHCTKAARQQVVFGTVMELHVPTHRDEQHHECHQKGADVQQPFFHGAKIGNFVFSQQNLEIWQTDT